MATKTKLKGTGPKQNQDLINMMNDQKFEELATYLTELMQGYQRAGQAINRLERFEFGLIKVLLDRGLIKYDDVLAAMSALDQAEDIEVYWGVKQASETVTEVVAQGSVEET